MFRGKESSNRIELSRLVQDLLNFGVLGSLQLGGGGRVDWGGWGWGEGGWGWWMVGYAPTHMHIHAHAHMHMHAHIHVKHDNFNCKWQPPLGESLGIPMMSYVHACAWVDGWFSGSMGGVRSNTKNLINLELIEIIQFCLKIYDL